LSPALRRFLFAFLFVASAVLVGSYALHHQGRTAIEDTYWVWGPTKNYWNRCASELRSETEAPAVPPALAALAALHGARGELPSPCAQDGYSACRERLLDDAVEALRSDAGSHLSALDLLQRVRELSALQDRDPAWIDAELGRLAEGNQLAAIADALEQCRAEDLMALLAAMNAIADLYAASGNDGAARVLRGEVERAAYAAGAVLRRD
jgi:hypothetical protein